MNQQDPKIKRVVRFLNLPPEDQIQFLYRYSQQKSLRKEVEDKVFGLDENEQLRKEM